MWKFARRLLKVGRIAEPPPPKPTRSAPSADLAETSGSVGSGHPDPIGESNPNRGSLQLRHVDAGSCNGCEIEIGAAFGPVYDAHRYSARLVASPRHADGLLVTGAVTRNMAVPLRRTYEAAPEPAVVIAVGDCARDCGIFAGAYGVVGPVNSVVPVDLVIPGCPPRPEEIVAALRRVTGQ
jgi:Ni,Fe-hydrogenase III small subunit